MHNEEYEHLKIIQYALGSREVLQVSELSCNQDDSSVDYINIEC